MPYGLGAARCFLCRARSRSIEQQFVGKDNLRAQPVQTLENIRAILVANKADMKDVVQITVYVTDIRGHEIADIRLKYFRKDGPTSVIVQVSDFGIA